MRAHSLFIFLLSIVLCAASRRPSPRLAGNACVQGYGSNVVVVYPVLINQYFLANETIVINGGLTINIDNAPTSISTVISGTTTSGSATVAPISAGTSSSGSSASTTLLTSLAPSSASTSSSSTVAPTVSSSSSASNPATSSGTLSSSVSTTLATSSTPPTASTTSAAFISGMLYWHNYYRANNGASPLTWDTTLAAYAQAHADACVFQHSGGPYGENLAEGTPTNYDYYVYLWYAEISNYNFASPNTATFSSWGHFSQVVWKSTTTLGCGYSTACPNNYLVCEYAPPGNIITQQELADNVGAPLSLTYNIPSAS